MIRLPLYTLQFEGSTGCLFILGESLMRVFDRFSGITSSRAAWHRYMHSS